jgi:hypothetical protein
MIENLGVRFEANRKRCQSAVEFYLEKDKRRRTQPVEKTLPEQLAATKLPTCEPRNGLQDAASSLGWRIKPIRFQYSQPP